MEQEIIKHDNLLIAKIITNSDWLKDLNFYSEEKDFLQVATWNYNKGKRLRAHSHKICKRIQNKTNEALFVKKGKLLASFYNEKDVLIAKKELKKGDIAIIFNGGHSYDILENNTHVLEIKNGPYLGPKKDKRVIEK